MGARGTTRPGTEWEPGRLAGPTVRSSGSHPAPIHGPPHRAVPFSSSPTPPQRLRLRPTPQQPRPRLLRPYPIGSPPLPQAPPQLPVAPPTVELLEGQPSHPMNSRDAGVGGRRANPEEGRGQERRASVTDGEEVPGCLVASCRRLPDRFIVTGPRSRRRGPGARARGPGRRPEA